jgi:hypothetical protein
VSGQNRTPDTSVRPPDSAGQRGAQARVIIYAVRGMRRADAAGMTKHPRIVSTFVPTLASLAVIGVVIGLAVSLAGCGDSATLVAEPPAPDAPLPATSTVYAMDSQLDLGSDLPGSVGQAVSELISATDDPDDPTRYIVDRIIANMADGTLKNIALAAEPFVTAYVNQRLVASEPQLLARLVALGRGLGDAAHQLGTMDTLVVDPDGTATHSIIGVRVTLDGDVRELGFADHDLAPVEAPVTLTHSTGHVSLGRHTLALSLGKTLRLVLDGAIVPHVDPGAVDLLGVLTNAVDCAGFGDAMESSLGFGSKDAFAAACRDALSDVARTIYAELDDADAQPLELDLAGDARAVDTNGDGRVDAIEDGLWSGTVSYAGVPEPLTSGSFSATLVH